MAEEAQTPKTQQGKKKEFAFAVGRRRESVARVRVYETVKDGLAWGTLPIKKGDIIVNQKPINEYFSLEKMRHIYSEPMRVVNAQNKYTITIKVDGGGKYGQLHAVVHGVARALSLVDSKNYRPVLKKKGFLTRDARERQRRMVGTGGKARREKQSPKR